MRILFCFFIIILLCSGANQVLAAEDHAGELTLTPNFQEDQPPTYTLEFKSGLNWDWLASDLNGSFSFPTTDEENSSLTAGLETPYLKNLKLTLKAKQDESYRTVSEELSYDWRLFTRLKGKLTYADGSRDALLAEKNKYSFDWNKGALQLGVDMDFLSYTLNYYQGFNNYPNAADDSSIKNYLSHEITWSAKKSNLSLSYQESTDDYPYDLNYTKAYWKEIWGMDFNHEFSKVWRCVFKYNQMDEDKGFNPDLSLRDYLNYKSYNVEFLYKPDKTIEISLQTGITDTHKWPNWVDLPDDWTVLPGKSKEDKVSGLERSVSLTYSVNLERFSGDLSFYSISNVYYSNDEVKMNAGFDITIQYPIKPFEISLKIAPLGDQSQSQGSYQLNLQYKF